MEYTIDKGCEIIMSFYTEVLENVDNDNISLSTLNSIFTAGDIKDAVRKYEVMLGHSNLEGKRIAILIDSIKDYIPLFYAINKLKGTVVPLSLQFRTEDLVKVLESLDPHIIFTVNVSSGFGFSSIMYEWARGKETKTTLFTSDDFITWEKHSFGSSPKRRSNNLKGGYITFTSGSTGEPKGIVCEDSGFDYTFRCLAETYELKPLDNLFIYSATSSFYWVVSSNTALKVGANLVVSDDFNLVKIVDTMEKTKCNKFTTTPSIFKSIYNFASKIKPEVLKNLELVCVVGEKITPNFHHNFPLMENCKFVSHYGSSEAGSIADGFLNASKDSEELEFVLVKGAEHKVVDGELLLKTGGMFSEYYNKRVLTEQTFENGWFKTGDLVEFTSDRTFKIVGRKKDVIKKGGQQVVSSEVEHFLQNIEGVKSVAVVGVPHDVYGEQVVAFVVAEGLTTKEIRSYCSGRISSYKIPDKVILIEELPLTHGKVDKQRLKSSLNEG